VVRVLPFRTENELRTTFRALGAVTPASAVHGKDLPLATRSFKSLLHRGVIREGAPGTFYLYEQQRTAEFWIRQALFWIVIVIVPVAIIQFCSGSP